MTHKVHPILAGAATLLLSASLTWAGEPTPAAPAFSETAYRAHIERLASDDFEGRAPGTEGEKKTLAYIEQQFRAAGLQPGIGDSFLQPVPEPGSSIVLLGIGIAGLGARRRRLR